MIFECLLCLCGQSLVHCRTLSQVLGKQTCGVVITRQLRQRLIHLDILIMINIKLILKKLTGQKNAVFMVMNWLVSIKTPQLHQVQKLIQGIMRELTTQRRWQQEILSCILLTSQMY